MRSLKKACSFILSVVALIVSLVTFGLSYYDSQLKNRPYIHVDFMQPSTWRYTAAGDRKMGVLIEISNAGSIPASNINFQWFIRTDKDSVITAPDKFFNDSFGSSPFPTTLAAGQKIVLPIYNPDISPTATKIYLNVVVTYEGTTKNYFLFGNYRKYWNVARKHFVLLDDKASLLIRNFSEWDRNNSNAPPTAKVQLEN